MPGPTVVIGTAGHIDHGKTALLRALTGIDADRLPEERARGMTIDVGYAHLTDEDGVELDFVDVPGHDRLIGNMLVGAGEIDAAMLVVAVVTKTDLVDPGRVADVAADVSALLAETSLHGVPVLEASSLTGEGLAHLRSVLRSLGDAIRSRALGSHGPTRLAIDRVFSPKGRGVVVTGSLRGGRIQTGASLRREPGGDTLRVRAVQAHGASREHHDGGRAALNVAGDAAGSLRRGDVLTAGAGIGGTERLLVELRRPAALGRAVIWPPRAAARLRLHIGTANLAATLRRIRGTDAVGLLALGEPIATFTRDRGV